MSSGTRTPSSTWHALLPMVPPSVTHNALEPYRRKDGSLGIRKSAALKEVEATYEAHVRKCGVPDVPLGGGGKALSATVRVCYPCAGSHAQGSPHTVKPDLDNLLKTIFDVLERCGVIANDASIADFDAAKGWSDPACVYIKVDEHGGA